jgi:cytochrome c553
MLWRATYNMIPFLVPLCYVVYACVACHSQKSNKSDQFIVELGELLAKVLHQSLNYEFAAKSVGATNYIGSAYNGKSVDTKFTRTAAQLKKAARK